MDGRRDHLCAQLQPIGAADMQWLVGHPHHCRLELVGGLRRTVRKRNDIAARAIDLVGEADRHRFPCDSLILTGNQFEILFGGEILGAVQFG